MYALIFVVVILVIVCCYASVHYSEYGRTINKFPGPAPVPILGNSWNFATCSFSDTYHKLQSFQDAYYPVVRFWAWMSEAILFIRHPDDIKTILTSRVNLDKSEVAYEPVRQAFNNYGILFSHAKTWKVRRRMLNNAFTPNLIKLYSRISDEHTVEFIQRLKDKFDIDNVIEFYHQLVLSSTSEAMMGVKLANLDQDLTKRYVQAIDEMGRLVGHLVVRPYIPSWMVPFLPIGRRLKVCGEAFHGFFAMVVNERRRYLEEVGYEHIKTVADEYDDATDGRPSQASNRRRLALLDLLLQLESEGRIDEKGVLDELEDIISASYDTTGYTLSYLTLLLGEHPEIQERARREVQLIMEECGGNLTSNDLQRMEYLECCFKESLRIFPSAPVIGRHLVEDITLQSGHKVPAGTDIIIFFQTVQMDPKYWPDPSKFDPDRFLPENIKDQHPYAYMPFSSGARGCIGRSFAWMNLKSVMARILNDFRIEAVTRSKNLRFQLNIALEPHIPIATKFIKIDRK
ncbi:hypothetical protein TKK_0010687 [Trichogramma kaykai]